MWLNRAAVGYVGVLFVLNLMTVFEFGKLRCVNRDGTYVLAGGGFTQQATRAQCEAHEAALLLKTGSLRLRLRP